MIPWLEKQNLFDKKDGREIIIEKDFKSFVLESSGRPIDFQIYQMMFAIKQLMEVCEKQQILIESINAMLKHENQVFKPGDLV